MRRSHIAYVIILAGFAIGVYSLVVNDHRVVLATILLGLFSGLALFVRHVANYRANVKTSEKNRQKRRVLIESRLNAIEETFIERMRSISHELELASADRRKLLDVSHTSSNALNNSISAVSRAVELEFAQMAMQVANLNDELQAQAEDLKNGLRRLRNQTKAADEGIASLISSESRRTRRVTREGEKALQASAEIAQRQNLSREIALFNLCEDTMSQVQRLGEESLKRTQLLEAKLFSAAEQLSGQQSSLDRQHETLTQIEDLQNSLLKLTDHQPLKDSLSLLSARFESSNHRISEDVSSHALELHNVLEGIRASVTESVSTLEQTVATAGQVSNAVLDNIDTNVEKIREKQSRETNKIKTAMLVETQETEALLQLRDIIRPRSLMPPLGRWSIDARGMLHVAEIVRQHRPRTVLELGGGVSTIWLGYLLGEFGGHLYTVENNLNFKRRTDNWLARHGLCDSVTSILSPLTNTAVNDTCFSWYDLTDLPDDVEFDMLLVDGPPGSVGQLARYPAVPALWTRLTDEALILLDDTERADEQEIIAKWISEFQLEQVDPGMSRLEVLRKTSTTGRSLDELWQG